jgi:hypothetical protein
MYCAPSLSDYGVRFFVGNSYTGLLQQFREDCNGYIRSEVIGGSRVEAQGCY